MNGKQLVASEKDPKRNQLAYPGYGGLEGYGDFAGYGATDRVSDFDIRDYLRIIYRRKWLIACVVLASLALGAVRTLMEVPLYTATIRLQIDRTGVKAIEGGNLDSFDLWDSDFLKTQNELLRGKAIAERAASALKLGDDPDFLRSRHVSFLGLIKSLILGPPKPGKPGGTRADRERAAAGVIQGNRDVQPVSGSRLVDISYSDPNPARAQRVVTALADAFIAENIDKRFQANSYAKTFLEDQTTQLKRRLETSEQELLKFAQKEQIVGSTNTKTEKSSIAEDNLSTANTALSALIAERIRNEQLWRQLETADAINMPQVLTSIVIQGLRAQRNTLVTEYQEKLETFKPSYPAMVQIKNKITEIDRQLATEFKTIKESHKAAYEASKSQEDEMRKRIENLKGDVLDLQQRSIQYNILKREVDTNRSLYEGLLQRQKEVAVAGGASSNNVFVVDRADVPGYPSSPNMSRALMLAFLMGIGAGVGAAYLLEQFDDTLTAPDDLERLTGLPTLGIIPKVNGPLAPEAELANPRSAVSEAYRSLCTALQFTTENGLPRTIVVTSAGPGEGKSLTSLAIARHFAAMGHKVLLVDADLRKPSLHKKLNCSNEVGLSNYLSGACTPPEAFMETENPNLAFMASGPLPPSAADLLGNARFMSLLSIGLEVFDLIVVDGPPVMGLADAAVLSNASAATIFVAGAGQARVSLVRGALKRLQLGRGPIVGTVLTKFDAKTAGYGPSHHYAYAYNYGGRTEAADAQAVEPRGRSPLLTGLG